MSLPELHIQNQRKNKIVGHLPKHNEIERKTDLNCPFCEPTAADLTSLTRHLYKGGCPKIKQMQKENKHINWVAVWQQMINANKLIT